MTPDPGARPPSARSVRTRRAVLDATAALLAEGGLGAATIDAIRDRSGVSKTTVYKHWPNRLCVAVDAFADRLALDAALPDTGTARGDLVEQIRRVARFYASPIGRVFAQLLAAAAQDPDAAGWLRDRLLNSRRDGAQQLWGRAVARGEARDLDPDIALDVAFGPVMWRLLRGQKPFTEAEAGQVADAVLDGLLAATPRERPLPVSRGTASGDG
ncbi:TetR/AcrR family transcriptional regulator C-terminal ligand-binding domain-containing protein [Cryptosporangium sp. NPDC051539]|uniref:TetR/AcrR family transcriptional regulator C-terminal ligand-binding domain-containing protein n=1 Tax=Cryptosporangium sp. NPDC051539 TaxID=3363962 RepID=UPI00378A9192